MTQQVKVVSVDSIEVEDGFNPRRDLGDLDELAESIARHGILQPLLVRPKPGAEHRYLLVDGERRLRATRKAGRDRVPVAINSELAQDGLVAALVTALKRKDLDPVEEAKAYGRLIDGGLTKKGTAETVGVPQKTVTVRLQILEVPETLHPLIASGEIALSNVPTLVTMAKASPKLAELVGLNSPGRIDAWAAERTVSHQQGKHGLWPASHIDVGRLKLDDEPQKRAEALSDQWSTWRPRFGEQELARARAAGVLYADNDDGYGYHSAVICDTELVRELTVTVLDRDYKRRQRHLAEQRKAAGTPEPGSAAEKRLKTERKAKRERERELAIRSRGANLDLGRRLLDQLAEVELSKDLAELFAYTILSRPVQGYWTDHAAGGAYNVAQLAARGLRYVLPDWQEERQLL